MSSANSKGALNFSRTMIIIVYKEYIAQAAIIKTFPFDFLFLKLIIATIKQGRKSNDIET